MGLTDMRIGVRGLISLAPGLWKICTLAVPMGVPQGCILYPILFSRYINGVKISASNFRILMYADDEGRKARVA